MVAEVLSVDLIELPLPLCPSTLFPLSHFPDRVDEIVSWMRAFVVSGLALQEMGLDRGEVNLGSHQIHRP